MLFVLTVVPGAAGAKTEQNQLLHLEILINNMIFIQNYLISHLQTPLDSHRAEKSIKKEVSLQKVNLSME